MNVKPAYITQLIASLREKGPVMLLESQMEDHPSSEKSYIAGKPEAWIKASSEKITVFSEGKKHEFEKNPWQALSAFREEHPGWLFGYLGYDLKNSTEDLSSANPDPIGAPDLFFFVPGVLIEVDKAGLLNSILGDIPRVSDSTDLNKEIEINPDGRISEDEYLELVQKAKEDITEGEYYEVNISHPLSFSFEGDSWNLYEQMKQAGPVPFGAYFAMDDMAVCCSSPERFIARRGDRVWSQPIKGTASRSGESDHFSADELKRSEKNRAENLMIVDLVRNDLSRIAKNSSVRVSNLFEIQTFETLHQMVSTVECEVSNQVNPVEIVRSCFPMGSMTGAPKIAAMKAIEAMENYKRGIYSGAIGYFNPVGDFDFNVVIRTALIKGKKLLYPVGGAITSDSDPKEEWEETLVKAKAITNILKKKEYG